jgi:periplasmic protein TonB
MHVELLKTSGSSILDNEVMRSLKQLGPVGSLLQSYTGQAFNLIAFFEYGLNGRRLR